jgi:hypothetical protein
MVSALFLLWGKPVALMFNTDDLHYLTDRELTAPTVESMIKLL